MFQIVDGVKFLEFEESMKEKEKVNKKFQAVYFNEELQEDVYLTLKMVNVLNYNTKMWMYVVKNNAYLDKRKVYAEVVLSIHKKLLPFLIKKYGIHPDTVLVDHESTLF